MTSLHVKAFRGKVPRTSDRLIGDNFAVEALNCKITSGRIDPIKGLVLVHTSLAAAITTMYRYRNEGVDNWLIWPSVVDVVRSPTAQDSRNRLFYTGDGEPRMMTFADAISGGGPYPAGFYVLGVYIPTTAPALAVVGGAAPVETRAYVYTFKTQYGEESAPSLPVSVSGNIDGSWDLSSLETAPPNSGTVSAATASTNTVEVTLDTVRGLAAHEEVTFAAVGGMTDLNATFTLLSVDTATNKVTVSLTTAQVYTAGGTWERRAPHNVTGMTKVIYRTVGTNTDYKRVAEIAAATTTYSDIIASTALGEAIPTLDSYTPPKNMHSLVSLANGALAGIAGNEVCFSEQYKPYSWPLSNRYAFAGLGVAACAAGNSVIVLTDGYPVVATATVPEAASVAKMEDTFAPCVSKRGVIDTGGGCLFPSHDGLWRATPSGAINLTNALYRHDEWQTRNPASFKAAVFDQRYYAMHDGAAGETARILVLDVAEPDSITEVDVRVDALYANPLDGKLYVGIANKVYEWDADDANRYLSFWKSREYQLGPPLNFSCAQVHARYSDIVPVSTAVLDANTALLADADTIDGAIGSTEIGTLPLGASSLLEAPAATVNRVQFSLLKDGIIVFTKELNSSAPFRLPGTYRTEIHAMQVSASIPVYSMTVAQGMAELAQVTV